MTTPPRTRENGTAAAILWASAFIVTALLISKAGELRPNAAYAGTAAASGDMSIVTASKGVGPENRPHELLYVADNRSEMLFIYEVEPSGTTTRVLLRGGSPLPSLFRAARGR